MEAKELLDKHLNSRGMTDEHIHIAAYNACLKAVNEAIGLTIKNNIPNASDAVALFLFYQKKSHVINCGELIPVNDEYLEQYKTLEKWLKTKHKDYIIND